MGLAAVRVTGEAFRFVYDTGTGDVTEVRRPGYTYGAVTDLNDAGVMIGYNDFGAEGFLLRAGQYTPLETPEAGRLFPTQINSVGVIVGLWGEPDDLWGRSRGFIATPDGDDFAVATYRVESGHATILNGINDDGTIAGLYHPGGVEAPGLIFTAAEPRPCRARTRPRCSSRPAHVRSWVAALPLLLPSRHISNHRVSGVAKLSQRVVADAIGPL